MKHGLPEVSVRIIGIFDYGEAIVDSRTGLLNLRGIGDAVRECGGGVAVVVDDGVAADVSIPGGAGGGGGAIPGGGGLGFGFGFGFGSRFENITRLQPASTDAAVICREKTLEIPSRHHVVAELVVVRRRRLGVCLFYVRE